MKIYVLIPVHNRKDLTVQSVKDLLAQDTNHDIEIVIIDDGSTDGTSEVLKEIQTSVENGLRTITILRGNGAWWWSRCIEEAIRFIKPRLENEDRILFLNDDVRIDSNYCSSLITVIDRHSDCIVMSQLVDISDGSYIDSSVSVSSNTLEIKSQPGDLSATISFSDVAPGRGTLYPADIFIDGLNVDSRRLPHYLSDYEFSIRAKRTGLKIVCSHNSLVYTNQDWGNSRQPSSFVKRFTAIESPSNIVANWTFWRTWYPEGSIPFLFIKFIRYRLLPGLLKSN